MKHMFKSSHVCLFSVLAAGVLAPTASFALGFRIPNQDAEATARGNAFVATANNPSAIYYNPAGITQLPGDYFQFGGHLISVNSHYVSPSGAKSDTLFEVQPVPQMFYTHALKDKPFTLGLGIYGTFGLGLEWPQDSGFRTLAVEGRLKYITLNPVVAWKVNDKLSLAIGPTVNYADVKLLQGVAAPGDFFHFRGHDFDLGFTFGALWQPVEKWSFGVKYNSATCINFSGHSVTSYSPRTTTTAEASFPQFIVGGISFRPTPRWNIEANVDWTDWETLNTVTFKRTGQSNIDFPFNWRSSFLYHFGVTRYLDNGYYVSAGYFFSENSTSELNFNPIVPDTDLHVGSVGVGHKGKRWDWALSGQIITGPARVVSSSVSTSLIGESANGRYRFFNQAVNFSITYHF